MLNAAMVLMILAGIFGMPALVCSGCVSSIGDAYTADTGDTSVSALYNMFETAALVASFGSIAVGVSVRKLKKAVSGGCALAFSAVFVGLLLQLNLFGLVSSLMLLVAAVMIFVAPEDQFRNVTRVEVAKKPELS